MPARLNYGPRLSEEKKVRQSIERAWERGRGEGEGREGESEEAQTESGTKRRSIRARAEVRAQSGGRGAILDHWRAYARG